MENDVKKDEFFEFVKSIPRLHDVLFDNIEIMLQKKGIYDISTLEACILYEVYKKSPDVYVIQLDNLKIMERRSLSVYISRLLNKKYIVNKFEGMNIRKICMNLTEKGTSVCKIFEEIIDDCAKNSSEDFSFIQQCGLVDFFKVFTKNLRKINFDLKNEY